MVQCGREEIFQLPVSFSFQIVHLQEATLKVRPACIQARCQLGNVGKPREVSPCPEDLLEERNSGIPPEALPLVVIPVIIYKLI